MAEADPLAALAEQVSALRRQRDQDHQAVTEAGATVARWNARLETEGIGATFVMRSAFKKLSDKVDALADKLSGALERGKLKGPSAPRWDGLEREQEAAQLAALRAWVDGVLRVQYPEYEFPGCWPAHRSALWELGNLHAEWVAVYGDPDGADLDAALWFHERWLPGTVSRLNKAINSDGMMGCRLHGPA